ncbi:MAG: NusG domain II-containing protein [Candidatus Riflebacteria bacterium]|nr:NusG domain II-containing protein [Candidatus Riflebacteria bacterium]
MEEKYIALKKSDWGIILFLVLLPLLIKVIYAFVSTKDVCFQIKYYANNKEIIENVEPVKTKTIIISGKIGNMVLEFDQEKGARVASSTCPCQVCVNSGWSKNDALVCVPNAVLIKAINSNKDNKIDAVTR